jgi:hypothetical protein
MRDAWLGMALVPYLAAAAADAWVHERGRRVPLAEQAVHAGLAAAMTVFLGGVFLGESLVATCALAAFAALLVLDELGFHRTIAAGERRLHVVSWIALAGFVAAWRWVDR